MTVLTTESRSRAEDAAHRAVADIGATVSPGDYRLIGGQMVTLLVACYQPPDAPVRTTADADVGVRLQLVADSAFVDEPVTTDGSVHSSSTRSPASASRSRVRSSPQTWTSH